MKVVLHEGTAPANGALKTRARLKRVTVPHRRSYVGCSGPLGNPTELKKILLREGKRDPSPGRGSTTWPLLRSGQSHTLPSADCLLLSLSTIPE